MVHPFVSVVGSYAAVQHTYMQLKELHCFLIISCRWFFQQLILAVDYCHRKGVANRDIKLENTLLQVGAGSCAA